MLKSVAFAMKKRRKEKRKDHHCLTCSKIGLLVDLSRHRYLTLFVEGERKERGEYVSSPPRRENANLSASPSNEKAGAPQRKGKKREVPFPNRKREGVPASPVHFFEKEKKEKERFVDYI